MENTGSEPAEASGEERDKHREPDVQPRSHADDKHRSARAERSVDRQVGDVEYLICDVQADRHDPPDDAVSDRAGEKVEE